MKNKFIVFMIAAVILVGILAGCSSNNKVSEDAVKTDATSRAPAENEETSEVSDTVVITDSDGNKVEVKKTLPGWLFSIILSWTFYTMQVLKIPA